MRYKPRPRQREPFGQTNHKRCVRGPYVPVDKFGRTHDHPADVRTLYLHHHDPAHGKQQSLQSSMHIGSKSISSVPCLVWPRAMGVSTSPGRIIAETSKETSLRADRLSHCGRRMSLFLLMLVLRGVCSIPANPVSTGVCYEQNSNYLA